MPSERVYNTPLAKKLGLTPARPIPIQVALIAAPENFSDLLGDLPSFTTLAPKLSPSTDLALCFVRSPADYPPLSSSSPRNCRSKPPPGSSTPSSTTNPASTRTTSATPPLPPAWSTTRSALSPKTGPPSNSPTASLHPSPNPGRESSTADRTSATLPSWARVVSAGWLSPLLYFLAR